MFGPKLEKFEDFKAIIDAHLAGELEDDIFVVLQYFKERYAKQSDSILSGLRSNSDIVFEHMELIKKLQRACKLLEEGRAGVELALAEERHDELEEPYEKYREGNRLLLDANIDLEEILEQNALRRQVL